LSAITVAPTRMKTIATKQFYCSDNSTTMSNVISGSVL